MGGHECEGKNGGMNAIVKKGDTNARVKMGTWMWG